MFKYLKKQPKNKNKIKTTSSGTIKLADPKKEIVEDLAYIYLQNPHITEKGTFLSEFNQYVFRIKKNTNKIQVKKAIESLYEIDVVGVNIINIPAKKKRIGRKIGKKPGYKKAIVKIKKGQKIEFI